MINHGINKYRAVSSALLSVIENYLYENGVAIYNGEREAYRNEDNKDVSLAILFGSEYYMLEDMFNDILKKHFPRQMTPKLKRKSKLTKDSITSMRLGDLRKLARNVAKEKGFSRTWINTAPKGEILTYLFGNVENFTEQTAVHDKFCREEDE